MWSKREELKQLINFVFRENYRLIFCVWSFTFLNFAAGSREGTHAHCLFHACRSRDQSLTNGLPAIKFD